MAAEISAGVVGDRCAAALALRLAELPPTFAVDDADSDVFRAHLAPDGAVAPATWAATHELTLVKIVP